MVVIVDDDTVASHVIKFARLRLCSHPAVRGYRGESFGLQSSKGQLTPQTSLRASFRARVQFLFFSIAL